MKRLFFTTVIALLVIQASLFVSPSVARADGMTCPPPVPVTIDIKPGNAQNTVKLSSKGVLAVAVLTTASFDATQFQPEMAHLNDANTPMADACMGASALRWSLDDENGDGKLDLVFFFSIQDLNFTLSTTAATLMAHGTYAGAMIHIEGTDMVHVVP